MVDVERGADRKPIVLYFDLKPEKHIDLEVAAAAAIEWCRTVKAAASAVDPNYRYHVSLIAAEPGSSRWLADIERSPINQISKEIKAGFDEVPLILRYAVGAAAFVIVTGIPTLNYYFGNDELSEDQLKQIQTVMETVLDNREVTAHRKAMYREVQRDPNIVGLGGGVPDRPDWRPPEMIPARRFAEADGLFELEEFVAEGERTLLKTLDVILVNPWLENAQRAWTFRQEGIPGTFKASMKDAKFLAALDKSVIQERLRLNIPMTIELEIRETLVNGEWRVKRRGRSVVRVLSPSHASSVTLDHRTTPME